MSLLSESVVGFSEAKQSSLGAVTAKSVSSPLVEKFVKGVVTGPIAEDGVKAAVDADGNVVTVPENALITRVVLSGQASFLEPGLNIILTDETLTVHLNPFPSFSQENVNAGCTSNTGLVAKNGVVCNILAVLIEGVVLPPDDVINITLMYMDGLFS